MWKRLLPRWGRRPETPRNGVKERSGDQFSGDLNADEALVRKTFARCDDIIYRNLVVPALGNRRVLLVFVEGIVDRTIINRDIIGRLLATPIRGGNAPDTIADLVSAGKVSWHRSMEQVKSRVLLGGVLALTEGSLKALFLETRQWPARAIDDPPQERTINGPREGFTEVLRTNLGMIRRRMPTPSLKAERMTAGRRTVTEIVVVYLDDVADPRVVAETRARIRAIDTDSVLHTAVLGELIGERTKSPFPLVLNTERPDKVVGNLLQGKIAILVEASPTAMVVPATFSDFYHSPDDYYTYPLFAALARALRFASIFIASSLTAAYTAVLSYHYEMIPRNIVTFIAESREGVPFTPFAEAILLEGAVEVIREASLRLPGTISTTIGIVGTLILGQAIVNARLISPVLLIVVGLSFMANYTIPNYEASLAVRYARFPILLAAGFL